MRRVAKRHFAIRGDEEEGVAVGGGGVDVGEVVVRWWMRRRRSWGEFIRGLAISQWWPAGSRIRPMRPAVLVGDGDDLGDAPGGHGVGQEGVGVFGNEEHADRAAAEGVGAEVLVFGGFFGDPEVGAVDGELGDASAGDFVEGVAWKAVVLEVEGGGVVFDGEGGGDVGGGRDDGSGHGLSFFLCVGSKLIRHRIVQVGGEFLLPLDRGTAAESRPSFPR